MIASGKLSLCRGKKSQFWTSHGKSSSSMGHWVIGHGFHRMLVIYFDWETTPISNIIHHNTWSYMYVYNIQIYNIHVHSTNIKVPGKFISNNMFQSPRKFTQNMESPHRFKSRQKGEACAVPTCSVVPRAHQRHCEPWGKVRGELRKLRC